MGHSRTNRPKIYNLSHVSISFLSKVMDRKRRLLWHVMTSSGHYTFLPITFDRKELETWGKCQSVCLDETHWLICNMTYLGHFRDLTWGQISKFTSRGHVMIKIGHVAYVSMRLDERDSFTPFQRLKLYFLKVTLQKTCNFPMTSSCDLRWPFERSLTPNDTSLKLWSSEAIVSVASPTISILWNRYCALWLFLHLFPQL